MSNDDNNDDEQPVKLPAVISTDDGGEFCVVPTNVVDNVSTVRCYDETLTHIAEQHPEFRSWVPAIEHAVHDTITSPSRVIQSNTDIHVGGYKYVSERHSYRGKGLVVAVKVVEDTSARLTTAYFTSEPLGNVIFTENTHGDDDV